MKALTKISIGFLALAAVALWFTSCSSEDVAQNGGGLNEKDQRVLLLSVNTGNLGTRSTTVLTPDEKQINDMTVGIYDKSGNYRVVAKLASDTDDKEASGSTEGHFKTNTSGVNVKVVTSTLQKDDQVLVAVNRGTTAFTSKPNSPTDFSKVTMDATTALQFKASSSTEIDATKFPKFGTATLPAGSNSTFTATVSVKNLVSKVTLEDLSVSFAGPYANATFTPEEIFLLNVPDKLAFSTTGQASTSTYLNGTNMDKSGGTTGTKTAVLATATTGATALSSVSGGTASYTAKPILYTIPNSNSTSNKTILVIAGKFDKDGSASAATEETVYYPLALNEDYSTDPAGAAADGATKSQTLAGKNYKCKVVIKTIGASNPWVTTGPQTAVLTVDVENWDDATQTTTFE